MSSPGIAMMSCQVKTQDTLQYLSDCASASELACSASLDTFS